MPWFQFRYTRQVIDEMVAIYDERRRPAGRAGQRAGVVPLADTRVLPARRRRSLFERIKRRIRGTGD